MTRNFHWFGAFAKLKRGVTLKQALLKWMPSAPESRRIIRIRTRDGA